MVIVDIGSCTTRFLRIGDFNWFSGNGIFGFFTLDSFRLFFRFGFVGFWGLISFVSLCFSVRAYRMFFFIQGLDFRVSLA